MTSRKLNQFIPIFLAVGLTLFYGYHTLDHFTFGDSVGNFRYSYDSWTTGTYATAHFLYKNSFHIFLNAIDWPDMVKAGAWFSLIFSVASALIIYRTVRLVSVHPMVAVMAACLWALSFTNWRSSVIIEIYTFHNCFVAGYVYFMVRDIVRGSRSGAIPVAILLGLSSWSHIQDVLMIPAFLLYLFLTRGLRAKAATFIPIGVFGLIFSFLIINALFHPKHGIKEVFFTFGFQGQVLSLDPASLLKGGLESIGYFVYNFWVGGILIVYGFWRMWHEKRNLFYWVCVAFIPTWGFAMRYQVSDNYVFFLPAYIPLMIAAGFGLDSLFARLKRWRYAFIAAFIVHLPVFYFLSLQMAEQIPQLDSFKERKAYKGGLRYYLWPGMNNNVDILSLSEDIYYSGEAPPYIDEFGWQYVEALMYLKQNEKLKTRPYVSPKLLEVEEGFFTNYTH